MNVKKLNDCPRVSRPQISLKRFIISNQKHREF